MTGEPTLEDIHGMLMSYDYSLEKQNGSEHIKFPQANATSYFESKKNQSYTQKNTQPTQFLPTLYPSICTFFSTTSTKLQTTVP